MEKKSSVHYVIRTKSSVQIGISSRDLGIEIPFKIGQSTKQAKAQNKEHFCVQHWIFTEIFKVLNLYKMF